MTTSSSKKPVIGLGTEVYAQWRASELGATTEALEDRLLLNFVGDPKDRQILDIGCGDGALTISLAERGARAVGLDPSSAMIDAAIHRAASTGANASFCVGRAESLPFEAEQFDLVVAKTILCFVDDATDMFTEISRVLRPDGRLVIGELGKWSTWAAQRYVRGRLGSSLWRKGHFWTVSELRALANHAGMTVTRTRGAVYYPRSLLAARLLRQFDDTFGRMTIIGAAFIAMSAAKQ